MNSLTRDQAHLLHWRVCTSLSRRLYFVSGTSCLSTRSVGLNFVDIYPLGSRVFILALSALVILRISPEYIETASWNLCVSDEENDMEKTTMLAKTEESWEEGGDRGWMGGRHHRSNGHEIWAAPKLVMDRNLACCCHSICKELDS